MVYQCVKCEHHFLYNSGRRRVEAKLRNWRSGITCVDVLALLDVDYIKTVRLKIQDNNDRDF